MYAPSSFAQRDRGAIVALMRDHGFAQLVTVADGAPWVSHLPLLHLEDGSAHGVLVGHMARANPQWRHFEAGDALAVFTGPHAYVSPRYYASPEQVPTWNYAVVHAHGRARAIDDPARARAVLELLVAQYEGDAATPWRVDDLPADKLGRLLQAITAFELPIAGLDGKWKVGQNRAVEDREAAAAALVASGEPVAAAVAALMRATIE
ncbi:MAG: FMN-binding negative transcriptional regulator, partial [Myxococcales bacterium]|nr:FMN-binding negative transcriptional regulator [Myxococcales bacterium]